MVRPCAERSGSPGALLLAGVGCALVLALTGCSGSPGARAAASPGAGSTYTLMQMNLCLSGLAGCYGKTAYPAAVEEAVARIRGAHPDAVTFNEAWGSGVALVAPRRWVQPGGRGLFGDGVLTKAAIERTDPQDFDAQAGVERRRWLCV